MVYFMHICNTKKSSKERKGICSMILIVVLLASERMSPDKQVCSITRFPFVTPNSINGSVKSLISVAAHKVKRK